MDRKDETGGELLETPPGVHQRGRVREKVEAGHGIVPALSRMRQSAGGRVTSFSVCDVARDTPEELRRRLDDCSLVVLGQISPTKNDVGMG